MSKPKPFLSQTEQTPEQKLTAEWARALPTLTPTEIARVMNDRPGLPPPESPAELWLSILPPPPQPIHAADEDDILMWLRAVAKAGGLPGLQWAWSPEQFPFGPFLRGRCTHLHGTVMRELEAESKRKAEEAARERVENERNAYRQLLKEKGWRVS